MSKTNKFGNVLAECSIEEINGPNIQIFSNKKIIVEGCYGLNEYSSDIVRINLPKGEFIILGRDLEIKNMEDKSVIVCGVLCSFEFSGENI